MSERVWILEESYKGQWLPYEIHVVEEIADSRAKVLGPAFRVRAYEPVKPKAKRKLSTGEFLDRLAALGGDGKAKRKAGR